MKKILALFIFSTLMFSITGCSINISTSSSTSSTNSSMDTQIEDDKEENQNISDDNNINSNDNDNINEKNSKENEQEQIKKVVVIDPGHASRSNLEKEQESPDSDKMKIKDGGGAEGISTKTPEYVVNMIVANKLKTLIEEKNITVIMTKTSNEVSLGNIERANIGNDNNADLVIRIHCDSSDNQNLTGASMLVPAKLGYASPIADISKQYGETILDSLVSTCNTKNRGVVERNDMTGFNWSKVPVVLVEMGFMSNPNEDILLNTDDYQNKLAQGLSEGIAKALNVKI